jgi:ribosomal protein L16 Arg81 hydroxylase
LLCIQVQAHPGEISARVLADVRTVLESLPTDDAALASWFGRYASTPRGLPEAAPLDPPLTASEFRSRFKVIQRCCNALLLLCAWHRSAADRLLWAPA